MLIRHTFIYSFGRLIPSMVNFLAIAAYTRLVLPDEYGLYGLALSSVAGASTALFYWLRQSAVRFLPEQIGAGKRGAFIGTYLLTLLFQIGAFAIIGLIAAFLSSSDTQREFILLVTGLLSAQAWCESSTEILRADLKPAAYSRTYMLRSFLAPVFILTAITMGWGAKGMILGATLSWILMPLQHLRTYLKESRMTIDTTLLKEFFRYGMPMTVSNGLYALTMITDRWVVAHFMGIAAVGLYGVGVDLAKQSLWVLLHTVSLAAMPLAMKKMQDEGEDAARTQLSQNLNLLMLAALPGTAGLAVLSGNISHVMLGSEYQQTAAMLLPFVGVAMLLYGIRAFFFDQAFLLKRSTVMQIPIEFITCVIGFTLNVICIPRFGVIGGAYAMMVTATCGLSLSAILGRRYFRLSADIGALLRVLLATGCMVAALWPLRDYTGTLALLAQIAVGGSVYALAAWLFNAAHCRTIYRRTHHA